MTHTLRSLPALALIALTCLLLPSAASAFGSTTTFCPYTGPNWLNTYSSFTFSKTGPATAAPGSLITYRFTITQHSPNACGTYLLQWAEKVVDIAPAGLRLIGAPNDNFIKCDPLLFPTILRCDVYGPKGQGTMTFDAVFEVSPDLPCGTVIKNQATMTYPKESMNPLNTGALTSEATTVITGGGCTSSSSSSSSAQSSSSSSVPATGCIEVLKETFNTQSQPLTPVTQFTFQLDGGMTAVNNGNGIARFENVTPGTHTVTESVPSGWTLLNVTPQNGMVYVSPGSDCAVVTFKNKQVLPASSSSSSSSSVQSSSSSSSPLPGCIQVLKETFNPQSQPLTPVAQFTFQLDGGVTAVNNGSGIAQFQNVAPGTHTVTESIPAGWQQLTVTPQNGTVVVAPGPHCAVVTFKNKQVLPPAPVTLPHCSDGLDNDADGRTDFFDPGCYPNGVFNPVAYDPNDNSEVNAVLLCRWARVNSQWIRQCR